MSPQTSFQVDVTPNVDPGQTLVVGVATPGLAGLTAADHLVRQLESEEIGLVTPDALPSITPVENGTPRNHTRLYNLVDFDLTVLVGELFVPTWAARSFAETLLGWVEEVKIDEVVFLHAIPYPHEASDHSVFYVATEAYQQNRLDGAEIDPLGGGVLDGVPGELVSRSLTGTAPPVGVYVTPAHLPGPDIDATLYLLDAIETVYDITIDMTELEDLSDEIRRYYATLSEQVKALEESDRSVENRDFGVDRMYM
jgi:uncharacterized protein